MKSMIADFKITIAPAGDGAAVDVPGFADLIVGSIGRGEENDPGALGYPDFSSFAGGQTFKLLAFFCASVPRCESFLP